MDSEPNKRVVGSVLVIGAGVAGIQASLDLADSGFKVHLLESSPSIGGTMAQLDKTFPTNDCSMCILSPKVVECARHLNIDLMTWSELEEVEGKAGDFTVRVRHKARLVEPDLCKGCGACARVCPIEVPSEFDEGLSLRKAIYRPYPQAVPNVFAIDKQGSAPCRAACPTGISIQGCAALIAQGRYAQALTLSLRANPFTSVCGRVCHRPCEDVCNRQLLGEKPVSMAGLARFMADWVAEHRNKPVRAATVTHEQPVAIVGSGPCGLTAARDLASLGYKVTVYESQAQAGGMLRYGIPAYRLPKTVLDQEIKRITDLGVEIVTNSQIDDLGALQEHDGAILLSVGTGRANRAVIEGEKQRGVYSALAFLHCLNAGDPPDIGRRVVVVGGGDTAMDAARCARRLGAEVTIIYRRSREEMPAHTDEIEAAIAEGVAMRYLANPVRILGREGAVSGIELQQMQLGAPDESGRRRPLPIKGSNYQMVADAVILALGEKPNLTFLPDDIEETEQGTIACDALSLATNRPGVFAAGSAVTGPRSAVEAIGMGHRAAESIHRYLSGESVELVPRIDPEKIVALDRDEVAGRLASGRVAHRPRAEMATLPMSERLAGFDEVAQGLTEEQAIAEAKRCLACGTCAECYRCVDVCPAGAINHSLVETYSELNVGAIILATGFDAFDARRKYELGYSRFPDVVTSIEFERILSASGPYEGKVLRPSDGESPRRIAFLQCVGSRDAQCGNTYCSSVCCMSAIKEAVIAKEHDPEIETTIFFMELRAFGKDFDKYYERARDEYGVRFVRSRVAKVEQGPDGSLDIVYTTEDEHLLHEHFDMVILSVGLEPSKGTIALIENLGLRRAEGGFCYTDEFHPVSSSREGIYACGAASGPKDIPETVMQASAAAAEAARLLARARNTLTQAKEYPAEVDVSGEAPRVGVLVCHCGTNIAGVVDVQAVREYAQTLPYVVYSGESLFACSQDSQESIKEIVRKHRLNRLVVSSCSPRTHEALFQETIREVGLNPYLFQLTNIRDQCSWVHAREPEKATEKSKDLVRMAVSRVVNHQALYGQRLPVTHSALVLGGGVSGLTAALMMAGQGYDVHLVEREPELGGNARQLHRTLRNDDVQEVLQKLIARAYENPRISVYTSATLKQTDGFVGNFESVIALAKNGSEAREVTVKHGVIILATGAEERTTTAYLYGQDPRVVTQRELEESLAEGRFSFPGDGPGTMVMIQCVESRTPEHPYCSRVCCSEALKNAITLKERYPDCNVYIVYRDIRSYGLRERYYQKARDLGVIFARYDLEPDEKGHGGLPIVENSDGRLTIKVYDPILQEDIEIEADTLALSVGIGPRADAQELAMMFKVPLNAEDFFLEAHVKLRPVEFATEGIYMAGLAHGPKFLEESIAQASAAVSRACTVLAQDALMSPGSVAHVDQVACSACGDCVAVCAYQAIELVRKEVARNDWKDCAEVNPALCKGCGACVATCRSGCITLDGFDDVEIMAEIAALVAQ